MNNGHYNLYADYKIIFCSIEIYFSLLGLAKRLDMPFRNIGKNLTVGIADPVGM